MLKTGAIIFGSDQEVREVMRAVRRNNATGAFSWIGSDGWSARNLVSDGNEPEVSTYTQTNTQNIVQTIMNNNNNKNPKQIPNTDCRLSTLLNKRG